MKTVKIKTKTIAELEKGLKAIEKQLRLECDKCEGTGKPKTKLGKPPKDLTGNTNCKTCGGEGVLGSRLLQMENNIERIKKELGRIKSSLTSHINKHTVEIRVLPEGANPKVQGRGGWEDYSGAFSLENEEEESIVVGKARLHFETYFQDGVYHRNRKLGMFLSSGSTSGKRLIEEMETGD